MPRLNVSRVINNPQFAQGYTVYRKTGQWVAGRFVEIENALNYYGTITAANVKDLNQVPEGDRVTGMMCFYSTQPIYVTRDDTDIDSNEIGTSDEIEWRGERYRIVQILPEQDWGYYKAFGTRIKGK